MLRQPSLLSCKRLSMVVSYDGSLIHRLADRRGALGLKHTHFNQLHPDLLLHIIRLCTIGGMRTLAQTCRAWRSNGWVIMRDEVVANDGVLTMCFYDFSCIDRITEKNIWRSSMQQWKIVQWLSTYDGTIVHENNLDAQRRFLRRPLYVPFSMTFGEERTLDFASLYPSITMRRRLILAECCTPRLERSLESKRGKEELARFLNTTTAKATLRVFAGGKVTLVVQARATWRDVCRFLDTSSPQYKRVLHHVLFA